jgi:hypothetical protein
MRELEMALEKMIVDKTNDRKTIKKISKILDNK